MTDQRQQASFYREPVTGQMDTVVTDVALVHLISGSADDPEKITYHATRVRDPALVPREIEPERMDILSSQIGALVRQAQHKYHPHSQEASRKARAKIGQVMGWLGELAAHDKDLVTAESAVGELRAQGGIANWRRARRLKRVIKTVAQLEQELPNRTIDSATTTLEV